MRMKLPVIAVVLGIAVLPLGILQRLEAEEVLRWQDCIKEAAKNHPDLIAAEEIVKQTEAGKTIAASGAFPQIESSLDASVSKSKDSAGSRTTDSYSYGVSGSQLLFDGFKTSDNVKAASENIRAARYSYRFTSVDVRSRLRKAFINLLKAQEQVTIAHEIFTIRRGNLELISLRYESGIEHRGALLTAQANLGQAEFQISQNKRALEVAQRELLKEMGRAHYSPLRVEGDFTVGEADLQKPDFLALAVRNPALGRLAAQKNAAAYEIKSAEADFFPRVFAQAGANKFGSRWAPDNDQLNAGLTVSLPLFEGGSRVAEVAQAKSIYAQIQANERSAKDGIIVSLEQSWAALQDAIDTVAVQKKFLDAAIERSKIAESQYSLGLVQFDNWTIIEDDLVREKRAYLDAQANALQAQADWVQAKGETLEYAD